MKRKKSSNKRLVAVLRTALFSVFSHKEILCPFLIVALVQVLFITFLYFLPREPMVNFFGPMIEKLYGDLYSHYPYYLEAMPKIFQKIQYGVFIFFSSLMIGFAIKNIADLNQDIKVQPGKNFLYALSRYVHLLMGSVILFAIFFYGMRPLIGLIVGRAQAIRSTAGLFYYIKIAVLEGAQFYMLFLGVLTTAIFGFLYPLIVLEKKNVFVAFFVNMKRMWGSYWFILFVVLTPSMLYVPLLLIRDNMTELSTALYPELRIIMLFASVLLTFLIDSVIYTSITTYYLLKKENS
jgi:hypothetical protein